MKQLKNLIDNELFDIKLSYYLKPTESPGPRFYSQPKIHKPGIPMRPIVSYSGSSLYNLNKYIANVLIMLKRKITTPRTLLRLPSTAEIFLLKMMK